MAKKIVKARKIPTIKTFIDAQKYAEQLGGDIVESLAEEMTEEEIIEALIPSLQSAGKNIARAARIAQSIIDDNAGLGLASLEPEFNVMQMAARIAQSIAYGNNATEKELVGIVDETVRINAEAREDLGLTTHIVRTYSDVGIRNGTKYSEDCEWCLSRCGEWNSYADAYAAGAFERHPGCKCEIDYYYDKTGTRGRFVGFNWSAG